MRRFFTDTHLGLRRQSHTTLAGQERLAERLFHQALLCIGSRDDSFMLGDLFDEYSNDEAVIAEGAWIAQRCRAVLGGNHDVRNRADVKSSLQLLADLIETDAHQIVLPNFDPDSQTGKDNYTGGVSFYDLPHDWRVVAVPHQMSQAEYMGWVDFAESEAKLRPDLKHMLLLHCNYDTDFGQITDDGATLNLSRERAETLLETFKYVLLGHEHVPKTDFDDRLIVLGNTLPLAFGEIADRFYYEFDTETGDFTRRQIFDAAERALTIDVEDFMVRSADDEWLKNAYYFYIDVQGTLPATEYPELGRRLVKLWKHAPFLLMCRNGVRMQAVTADPDTAPDESVSAAKQTIPEIITAELAGGELAALFAELSAEEAAVAPAV